MLNRKVKTNKLQELKKVVNNPIARERVITDINNLETSRDKQAKKSNQEINLNFIANKNHNRSG